MKDYQKKINGMYEYACDYCGELYQLKYKTQNGARHGQWEKAYLCPKHISISKNNSFKLS